MKNIFKTLFALTLFWLAVMFFMAFNAKALTISFEDEIQCGNILAIGCYSWGDNREDIKLKNDLWGVELVRVFLHELGHHYTVRKLETKAEKERIADNYVKYIAQELLLIGIKKPYVRYIDNPDVYEYQTGRKIGYDEAVENNIWNDIQELPFYNKILFGWERDEILKLK